MSPQTPPNQNVAQLTSVSETLKIGMHVRIPDEPGRSDGEYRQFYLGRIVGIDDIAGTVRVRLYDKEIDGDVKQRDLDCPCSQVHRCHVLPDSEVFVIDREAGGRILIACEPGWSPGQFCDYYVQIEGQTLRVSENNLIAASHRGDPDPAVQLATYELQNPSFKHPRDLLVESYAELRAATFGIEDLVGSRIMLLAHQAEVVATVLSDAECRYILADEVGLGKTIEAAVILKGLRRRHPKLRTLVVAPASLVAQWYFELDHKFWLRFETIKLYHRRRPDMQGPGLILSQEQLLNDADLTQWVMRQHWDLLVVDEAHNIPKHSGLNDLMRGLSVATPRVLLLSATPIQRHATEFLALLRLLNPMRYQDISVEHFSEMVNAQFELMQIVASLKPDLTPTYFDLDDFCHGMQRVLELLPHDQYVSDCAEQVRVCPGQIQQSLGAAQAATAYLAENYRLERRVIRNRRANLEIEMPIRRIHEGYAYQPTATEAQALAELYEYVDILLTHHNYATYAQELARLLLHSAFSSPHALLELLQWRQAAPSAAFRMNSDAKLAQLATPKSVREEGGRIRELFTTAPIAHEEVQQLERVIWQVQRYQDEMEQVLDDLPYRRVIPAGQHRFVQVLHTVDEYLRGHSNAKIVLFSSWLASLSAISPYLRRHLGKDALFEFHVGVPEDSLQDQVTAFQEVDHQAILLCDELGGEGRNFQMADLIVHLDLPWSPAKLEQRIGRVDRLGRSGEVLSVVPYARDQIEQDLYQIWQHAFELFTRSMSGMEIALEGIQDELVASLRQGTRDGLARLLPGMKKRAQDLREQVELERYYEESARGGQLRQEFARISARYADGALLREPVLEWAGQAGLANDYRQETDTAIYFPRNFSQSAMQHAKFSVVPNMQDALERSRRATSLRIEGTFNRSVAMVREDLVFYAPGSDPWTDAIIRNVIEADRGRCCAIRRESAEIDQPWMLFDLTYHVQVDPRPLLALGHDPIHLLAAQGFLYTPIHRLLLNHKGERVPPGDVVHSVIRLPFHKGRDTHLGQRSGQQPPIAWFKKHFPAEKWHAILQGIVDSATKALAEDFEFTDELADEARDRFVEAARGMQAAANWYAVHQLIPDAAANLETIETYRAISEALDAGLRHPLIALESVCCWILLPLKH